MMGGSTMTLRARGAGGSFTRWSELRPRSLVEGRRCTSRVPTRATRWPARSASRLPEGECKVGGITQALAEQKVSVQTCAETKTALTQDVAKVPSQQRKGAYLKALVEKLGFDPRGEQAPKIKPLPEKVAPKPVPLAQGQAGLSSLAVDQSHVYWTMPNPAGVFRAPTIGGTAEQIGKTADSIDVTVTRDFVYWVSRSGPTSAAWVDKKRGTHEPAAMTLEGFAPARAVFMGADFAFIDGTGAVCHRTRRRASCPSSSSRAP